MFAGPLKLDDRLKSSMQSVLKTSLVLLKVYCMFVIEVVIIRCLYTFMWYMFRLGLYIFGGEPKLMA